MKIWMWKDSYNLTTRVFQFCFRWFDADLCDRTAGSSPVRQQRFCPWHLVSHHWTLWGRYWSTNPQCCFGLHVHFAICMFCMFLTGPKTDGRTVWCKGRGFGCLVNSIFHQSLVFLCLNNNFKFSFEILVAVDKQSFKVVVMIELYHTYLKPTCNLICCKVLGCCSTKFYYNT